MGITIKPLGLTAPIGRVAYAGGYGRAVRETAAAIREESRFRRQLEEQKRRAEAGIESAERQAMATEAGRMIRDQFGRKAREGEVEAITERAYGLQEARERMQADREQEKATEESIEALFSELAKSADPIVQRKVKQLRAGYVAGRVDPRFQRPQYAQQIRVQTADQLLKLSAMAPRVSPQEAALERARQDIMPIESVIPGSGFAPGTLLVRSGTRWNIEEPAVPKETERMIRGMTEKEWDTRKVKVGGVVLGAQLKARADLHKALEDARKEVNPKPLSVAAHQQYEDRMRDIQAYAQAMGAGPPEAAFQANEQAEAQLPPDVLAKAKTLGLEPAAVREMFDLAAKGSTAALRALLEAGLIEGR